MQLDNAATGGRIVGETSELSVLIDANDKKTICRYAARPMHVRIECVPDSLLESTVAIAYLQLPGRMLAQLDGRRNRGTGR